MVHGRKDQRKRYRHQVLCRIQKEISLIGEVVEEYILRELMTKISRGRVSWSMSRVMVRSVCDFETRLI
jgi:hypothetical protein